MATKISGGISAFFTATSLMARAGWSAVAATGTAIGHRLASAWQGIVRWWFGPGDDAAASSVAGSGSIYPGLRQIGANLYQSARGLIYGPGVNGEHRIDHVLKHLVANPTKPKHTVFSTTKEQLFNLIDEAWASSMRTPVANDPGAYVTPMGRVVGTAGETMVKIIVQPGTTNIKSAYPIKG